VDGPWVGSDRVQEAADVNGSGRVGSGRVTISVGRVPKLGPACNSRRTTLDDNDAAKLLCTRHGTGSLGHRVNGSFGSSFTSGSPGPSALEVFLKKNMRYINSRFTYLLTSLFSPGVRPEFLRFLKNAKMQNVQFKC